MNIAWRVMRRDRPQLLSCVNLRITGIFFRHPHDQAVYLGEDTETASALVRVRPLPHDELPMPP
jgi:hypothetical protein